MCKCKLLVHNSTIGENEWINGKIVSKRNSDPGEEFPYRYDIKTERGIFEGCHPDCIKK